MPTAKQWVDSIIAEARDLEERLPKPLSKRVAKKLQRVDNILLSLLIDETV